MNNLGHFVEHYWFWMGLILYALMDSSCLFDTIYLGCSIVYIDRHTQEQDGGF